VSTQLQLTNISNIKKYCKMGDLSDFQRGQIVGVCLAGASVTKTATLLGVSRAAVYEVVMKYTHHGRTSSPKRNSHQKPELNERDHHTLKRIVTISHRSTAAKLTAELSVQLEDRFHKNSLMGASQIQHPW
jgi:transposase